MDMETGASEITSREAGDDIALTSAAQRLSEGVTAHREFPPADAARIVRAGMRWREAALRAHERAEFLAAELQRRDADAIGVFDRRGVRSDE